MIFAFEKVDSDPNLPSKHKPSSEALRFTVIKYVDATLTVRTGAADTRGVLVSVIPIRSCILRIRSLLQQNGDLILCQAETSLKHHN
jgi:hypothetical protein